MSLLIKDYLVGANPQASATVVVAGVVTAQVISKEPMILSGQGTLALRLMIEASAVTAVGAITAKIQQASPNGSYADLTSANNTVTISGNGTFTINLNCYRTADAADMPLAQKIRVILTTTNAGDRITVNHVYLQQDNAS